MRFPVAPGNRRNPSTFPTMMFSSMMLPVTVAPPGVPMPKLLPAVENPFPLTRFARNRLRLAPPASHIPPQAETRCPFRKDMLFSIRLSDPLPTQKPEAQLVELVTSLTVEPLVLASWTPWPRNCRTSPGPRIVALLKPFTKMPVAPGPVVPSQALAGSASPVIVKPFKSSVSPCAPNLMQASLAVQVTSATNLLSSVIVKVEEMVPPISAAWTQNTHANSALIKAAVRRIALLRIILFSLRL